MEIKRVKKKEGEKKKFKRGRNFKRRWLNYSSIPLHMKISEIQRKFIWIQTKITQTHTTHSWSLFLLKKIFLQYSLKIFQPYGKGCACQARHYWIPDNWRNVLIIFLLLYSLIWLEFVFCDGKHRLILGSKKFVF